MTRAGRMVKAKKNSYGREYFPDGSGYHYPPRADNLLRRAGEEYFENLEITGSKETAKGKRKFALTKWLLEDFFPKLKEFCQQLEHNLGKRIHVRGQWDNASPHTERAVVRLIEELFTAEGWVWTTQPSNSPLTNILDAAIFPALAKYVSSLQGLYNAGRYLQCERLWEFVLRAWEEYPLDRIARAFVHHAQVAAATYNCNGGDEFVQERNGLSFGVRRVCRIDYGDEYEGDEGAINLTSMAPRDENRVPKGVIVTELWEGAMDLEGGSDKKLKYDTPSMAAYDIAEYLSHEELALIAGDVNDANYDSLDESQKARYDKFVEAWYTKLDEIERPARYNPN